MSKADKKQPSKKMKQDLVVELNNVLMVRAEQIRQRLHKENQTAGEGDNEAADLVESEIHSYEKSSLPVTTADQVMVMNTSSSAIKESNNTSNLNASPSHIPVSKARQRRRQKVVTTVAVSKKYSESTGLTKHTSVDHSKHLHGGSNVNIKNYRPGYNWNMGGRVKELRIRCIARKYLFIWQKNVFGRVPLAVAKQHYEKNLLHKAFVEWHDFWWEIAKEWRLDVRAECHHRYKLGVHVFTRWIQYVISRKEKKAKLMSASRQYNNHVLCKCWKGWKDYIKVRQKKKLLAKKADEFQNSVVTRHFWKVWKGRKQNLIIQHENLTLALQFWAYRIQAQHWLLWKSALELKHTEKQRYIDAAVYHNSVVVSKCLRAWTLYIANKRTKRKHAEFATRVYSANLKVRCFNHWSQSWHMLRSLQQHKLKIESHSKSFRYRWVFWRWRQYVTLNKNMKEKDNLAVRHWHLQLMRVGFDAFRLNVVHANIKVMRGQLVTQLRTKQLQRSAWNKWKSACEEREELKMAPQTKLARDHRNSRLLQKCFSALVNYTTWKQHQKQQFAKADAHFYLQIMPKCLYHMRAYVELEKTCRENAVKAKEFRRFIVQQYVFQIWYNAANQSRDERMMCRMALLHRESVLLHSFFALWRQRRKDVEQERERINQVRDHYLWTLCSKVWCAWRKVVEDRKTLLLNTKKACRHYHLRKMRLALQYWKQWVREKKEKKEKMKKAVLHYKFKSLKMCLKKWKTFIVGCRKFKSVSDVRYQAHASQLVRQTFLAWRKTAVHLASIRKKILTASVHYNRKLMHQVIISWHRQASIQAYKTSQNQQLLRETQEHLDHFKLGLYFKHWKDARQKSSELQQCSLRAESHYGRSLLCKTLKAWKIYCRSCLKKRLLLRQCIWFHNVRITAKHYLIWKTRLAEHREEMEKSQLAMWQWSLVLQKKVLLALKVYVQKRRYKKSRLAEAAVLWRQNLLHEACGQWLSTADSLSHRRSVMAEQHQAKSVLDSFQLVHRCALHWKIWAKRRGETNKVSRDITPPLMSSVFMAKDTSKFPVVHTIYSGPATHPVPAIKPGVSPVKPVNVLSKTGIISKQRPAPKRPAFLIESLKRAGLQYLELHSEDSHLDLAVENDQHKANDDTSHNFLEDKFNATCEDVRLVEEPSYSLLPERESPRETLSAASCGISAFIPYTKTPNVFTPFDFHAERESKNKISNRKVSDGQKFDVYGTAPDLFSGQTLTQTFDTGASNLHGNKEDKILLLKPEDFMKKPLHLVESNSRTNTSLLLGLPDSSCRSVKPLTKADLPSVVLPLFTHTERESDSPSSIDSSKENFIPILQEGRCESNSPSLELHHGILSVNVPQNNPHKAKSSVTFKLDRSLNPEEEIISIRDRLQHFKQWKQRLRSLKKQHHQLSDWLVEHADPVPQDEDIELASKELEMIKQEMTELQAVIDSEKPVCERLILRAQILAEQFNFCSK